MKTFLRSIFILAIAVFAFSTGTSAQTAKPFKGIVTFLISYSGNIDAATLAQQPKMVTISILNNKQKMSMAMGPVTFDQISDGDKKESITLVDMMGQKKYFKSYTAEIESELTEKGTPEVKYLEETKTIAGYACKKALYLTKNSDGETDTTIVFYTLDLGGEALNFGSSFHGLKGFPMEYVIKQNDIIVTYAASEVKKGKVKDTDFLIPAEYVEFTAEEKAQMKAAFKGGE